MSDTEQAKCALCGEPMPPGEQMFKFHGYSGPCPKPPLPRPISVIDRLKVKKQEALAARMCAVIVDMDDLDAIIAMAESH